MFFKNIYVFAFTRPFTTTDLELHAALGHHEFTPLGSTELRHFGWVRPIGKVGNFTNMSGGNTLICARSEEKILPTQYMNECIGEQVEAIESEQGRGVTKKEREQIKEDVVFNMLPRAFTKVNDTHAYINAENNTIVINSSSRGKAEDLLALLRKTLGTLPVTSVSPEMTVDEHMTNWVKYNDTHASLLDSDFKLGYEAHFSSLGDSGAIAIVKNQDLCEEEVQAHLDADKYVTKLALEYDETMSFMLNDDLSIKRIKFFDVITEQNDDIDLDDLNAKIMADFTLMAGELNRMITDLFAEFNYNAKDCLEEDGDVKEDQLVKLNVNQEEVKVESDGFAVEIFYDDAVEFIKETRRASISSIQRKFRIGYNRAARLMNQLEEKGIVSLPGHDGAREVLI